LIQNKTRREISAVPCSRVRHGNGGAKAISPDHHTQRAAGGVDFGSDIRGEAVQNLPEYVFTKNQKGQCSNDILNPEEFTFSADCRCGYEFDKSTQFGIQAPFH
jgi:hypothetical protein